MKVVRYSVQEHPAGYAVWELCADFYAVGACRYELWGCQCLHTSGGSFQSIVKVLETLPEALEACSTFEAATGGIKEIPDGALVADLGYVEDGDVPY